MPTRNVVLTDRQTDMIDRLIVSGRYQNASEVLREGLRLLEQRDAEDRAKLKALREAVRIGIDDFAAGRYRTFESRGTLRKHLATIAGRALTARAK
ncbi:MAG: type II toxin-antitoxin system ParD family antitoxin [Alphaproteobacteria bacterium]